MRALQRFRLACLLALTTGALGAGLLWRPPRPFLAAPARAGLARQGALEQLRRARLEQALIRAESTARMLRHLEASPTLRQGSP